MSKILVVDDDFQQRDLYFELFRANGFDVTAAVDGQDAWEKTQVQRPDLLFTGIMMPRMTGFELIEKLRANPSTASIPVIVFSHLGRDEDRKRAQKLPMVDFKVKGYDSITQILSTVKKILEPPKAARNAPIGGTGEDDDRSGPVML